jgi:PII-like signaling protein
MRTLEEGCLLRIFVGESKKWQDRPLYEAILGKAHELHVTGAAVWRGPIVMRQLGDLPAVVEIIEAKMKIDELLGHLDEMIRGQLVTLEAVKLVKYAADAPHAPA